MQAATGLAPGFADPVLEGQRAFRAVMDAFARPGSLRPLPCALRPPAPLTPELAAVALTLADHDAALWLDPVLAAVPAVAEFLTFHTGAPIVARPKDAGFALVTAPAQMPLLEDCAPGSLEYPDRSTTLVVAVTELGNAGPWVLQGPGIAGRARLSVPGLDAAFLHQWRANHALFPRGVDCLFASPGQLAGLPRSTALSWEG